MCIRDSIDSVETYAFQGGIFDGLSAEYQEAYLDASLAGYEGMLLSLIHISVYLTASTPSAFISPV